TLHKRLLCKASSDTDSVCQRINEVALISCLTKYAENRGKTMNTQKIPFSAFVLLLVVSVLLLGAKASNGVAGTIANCGSWHIVSSPNLTRSNSLAAIKVLSSSDIWAVGQAYKTPHTTISQTLTEHWNGMQWNIVASPHLRLSSSLLAVTAVSTGDVW